MLTFPLVSGGGGRTRQGPSLKWATETGTPVTVGLSPCSSGNCCALEGEGSCLRKFYSLALTWRQLEDKKHARDFYQVTVTFLGWDWGEVGGWLMG